MLRGERLQKSLALFPLCCSAGLATPLVARAPCPWIGQNGFGGSGFAGIPRRDAQTTTEFAKASRRKKAERPASGWKRKPFKNKTLWHFLTEFKHSWPIEKRHQPACFWARKLSRSCFCYTKPILSEKINTTMSEIINTVGHNVPPYFRLIPQIRQSDEPGPGRQTIDFGEFAQKCGLL